MIDFDTPRPRGNRRIPRVRALRRPRLRRRRGVVSMTHVSEAEPVPTLPLILDSAGADRQHVGPGGGRETVRP